jgi:hypothetical protein
MSSPIQQTEDLDPALRYAPRWARDQLPPMSGRPFAPPPARPGQDAKPQFSGDRAMLDLQRQLVLNPDAIPEPAVDDARTLGPIVLRLSAVIGLAALIAWGVVSLPGIEKIKIGEVKIPDVDAPAIADNSAKATPAQSAATLARASEGFVAMSVPGPVATPAITAAGPPINSSVQTSEPAPVAPVAAPAPAAAAPAPTPAAPPAEVAPVPVAVAAAPQFGSAEIAAMVKRGKDFLMTGDLASARLLFRRAAEAGSAEAALALGATFDPLVIARLGAVGAAPDVKQARQWYQRAMALGSPAASAQLAKLAQAQ